MKSDRSLGLESIDLDIVTEQARAKSQKASKKLLKTTIICGLFMVLQFVGGLLANSIAIMSDAAHLLSDFSGFLISLFAIWMSQRPASLVMTFGYHRAEIIGALCGVILIWGLTLWLVYEAVLRVIFPAKINGGIMLITAGIGLGFNLVMGLFLHHHDHHGKQGHKHEEKRRKRKNSITGSALRYRRESRADLEGEMLRPFMSDAEPLENETRGPHPTEPEAGKERPSPGKAAVRKAQETEEKAANVNVRAAMIHVIGDIVQSIGVIAAATVIYFWPNMTVFDPICTFIFSVIVMFTTVSIVSDCINVLMEGTPEDIDTEKIKSDINMVKTIIFCGEEANTSRSTAWRRYTTFMCGL